MKEVNVLKDATVKTFDVIMDGRPLIENLKTFEEAEAFIIAHDNKERADWSLAFCYDCERAKEFKHHQYTVYHAEGNVMTYADDLDKMSFEDLCEEAAGWRAISVVEFKF